MPGLHPTRTGAIAWLLAPLIAVADATPGVPGWRLSGSTPEKYEAKVDEFVAHGGAASASLAALTDVEGTSGFGTLMQVIDARRFAGKRVRYSAYLRASGVTGRAALWMRVDGRSGETLAFDNMSQREDLIRGDRPWLRAEIVLDVPEGSKAVAFGVLLDGEGMLWIDDASLEEVGKVVATTGFPLLARPGPAPRELSRSPANLDFEQAPVD